MFELKSSSNGDKCKYKAKMTKIYTASGLYCSVLSVFSERELNRKSHTGFRLVPTSMTLDDLE